MRDRFGPLPKDVENLTGLAKLKNLCSSIGLSKVDIQPRTFSILLPGENQAEFYSQPFFQELIASLQSEWMQVYAPRFQQGKKMKLLLHHPPDSHHEPAGIMEHYRFLLEKLNKE